MELLFGIGHAVLISVRIAQVSEYTCQLHMRALCDFAEHRIPFFRVPYADTSHPGINFQMDFSRFFLCRCGGFTDAHHFRCTYCLCQTMRNTVGCVNVQHGSQYQDGSCNTGLPQDDAFTDCGYSQHIGPAGQRCPACLSCAVAVSVCLDNGQDFYAGWHLPADFFHIFLQDIRTDFSSVPGNHFFSPFSVSWR